MKPQLRNYNAYLSAIAVIVGLGLAIHTTDATARSLDEIQETGFINIVTTSTNPPHGFLDPESEELKGIMFQVGRSVAQKLDVEPKFTEVTFSGLIPSTKTGRADLMSGPLFITEKREEQIDFTQPIYGWGEGLLVRDDNNRDYPNLNSLKGARVGVLVDSVQYDMIKEIGPDTLRTYKDYPTLLADMRAERIDVGVIDPPSIAYQMKTLGIEGMKFVEDYDSIKDWAIGMAVKDGNQELLAAVNQALTDMKQSGELQAILEDWGVGHLIAD